MAGRAKKPPATAELLTLGQLADRWGESEDVTRRIVRESRVPFISFNPRGLQITWARVRFRLEEIIAWEKSQSLPIETEAQPTPARAAGGLGQNWWR